MSGQTLGEFLRQERERRGITIEQVASATKISVRLLHSIEADRYGELPAKPFVRGFVQSYARFVGLDASEILARYRAFIDERSADRPARDSGHSGYAFEKRDGDRSRQVLWAFMGSFVVLGAIVFFVVKPAFKHRKETPADRLKVARAATAPAPSTVKGANTKESEGPVPASGPPSSKPPVAEAVAAAPAQPAVSLPVKLDPVPEEPEEPAPPAAAAPAGETAAPADGTEQTSLTPDDKDPLKKGDDLAPSDVRQKVVFKSLADIWIRYQVDDRPVMRFMLRGDRIIVLKAKEQVRFQVSNPKAAMVRYRTGDFRLVDDSPNLETVRETATLVFPVELAEKINDPFPGVTPLPHTPDPE